jgi:hypothetical protein
VITGGTDLLGLMKDKMGGAKFLSMNGYKVDLTKALVRRALTLIANRPDT